VRHAAELALARARDGDGPSVIEALTYRLADHTTSDDARRYRDAAEVERARESEPLGRLRAYLAGLGAWSEADEAALVAECDGAVAEATESYLALDPEPATAMFDWLFAEMPAEIRRQRDLAFPESATDDA
jgi:2-oxoisovalerate dehydrogenase E1 component alpha subunit